jgi:hypothetical protein
MADHPFVVICSASGQKPLQQNGSIQLHQYHQLDRLLELLEKVIQGDGLGKIAREPIQKPAPLMLCEALMHDCQHKGITHELSASHDGLRFLTQGGACLHLCPEKIPRGQVKQVMGSGQFLGLGALTGTWGAEKKQALFHGAVVLKRN